MAQKREESWMQREDQTGRELRKEWGELETEEDGGRDGCDQKGVMQEAGREENYFFQLKLQSLTVTLINR